MHVIDINLLCSGVANAVEQVQIGFRSHTETSEVLDRLWCLQDQIARLVESASEFQEETFDLLKRRHPDLIRDIEDVLNFTEKLHLNTASAMSAACCAIRRSLKTLRHLEEQFATVPARL